MRRAGWLFALINCIAVAAHANMIDGSVYLLRNIGPDFTSWGQADFRNDLGNVSSAELSGTHRVSGPQTFETAVTGNGSYLYDPPRPGAAEPMLYDRHACQR